MNPRSLILAVSTVFFAGCPKVEASGPVAPDPIEFPATMPAVQPDYTWAPPAPEVVTTVAGARLWHVHRPGLPLVSVRVVLPGGSVLDPPTQPGLTAFSDAMLLRGAGDLDAAAFSAALQAEAIDLSVSTGRTSTVFSADCTVATLPTAMRLLRLALTEPRFDADEVERARTQRVQARRDALDDPRAVASSVGWKHFYGSDSPYAHPPDGTAAALESVEVSDLRGNWDARARPAQAHWVLVGDLDTEASLGMIQEHFESWEARGAAPPSPPPPPGSTVPHARGARFLVDNPGASQTVLRVWMPGWSAEEPQRVAGDLGTVVLGGTFTSRLNALLREEKGYTYGARASLVSGRGLGTVTVSTNVFIDQTGPALSDLATELHRFTSGITEAEAGKATASRRTDAIEVAASRAGSADLLASLAADGRNADGQLADLHMAARIEASDINGVLQRLQLDASLVVVVGDLERVRADVEAALPGDWVQVDVSGEPPP